MPNEAVALQPPTTESGRAVVNSRRRRLLLGIGGVLAVFLAWEVVTRLVAYTDDAYVRSDLVSIAPTVGGHVVAVDVGDNQAVRRGQLLAKIDPVPYQLAVDARQAQLRAADAQIAADRDTVAAAQARAQAAASSRDLAAESYRRVAALSTDRFASAQAFDTASAALRDAEAGAASAQAVASGAQQTLAMHDAQAAQALADLADAEWRLGQTRLLAPVDGTTNNLTVRVGDTARPAQPLIGIVDAHAWRIVANYKQDVLRRLHVGGTAWVWLDSHPWHFWRARIQGIGRAISRSPNAPGLLPYVAPTTDWIRLQRRFPVTLVLVDPPPHLTLYMGADARSIIFP